MSTDPKVREVEYCGVCPAYDGEWSECQLVEHRELAPSGEIPPWCPLRKHPITLRLKP